MSEFIRQPEASMPGEGKGLESAELLERLYDELRRLAQNRLAGERAGHTLEATALVHEAYMRLASDDGVLWDSERHFFGAASEAMRRVLVDHARLRGRLKRSAPDLRRITLGDVVEDEEFQMLEMLAVDEALEKLEGDEPDVAEVVRLRFFGGLTVERVAELTGKSARTVKRDWAWARATLYRSLGEDGGESSVELR